MSDSDADSSSLPPPPPPLPHSSSPKAHGSKNKGSPFEGAIQLPMPSSTNSGNQTPLNQPSNDSSSVLRNSEWSASSETSTPPITDAFDPFYGNRCRRRWKKWLVGILTTIALVVAVLFGVYLAGQRQIFLKHIQDYHNETSTTLNEPLVNSTGSGGEDDPQITHTTQPTEILDREEIAENDLNISNPASIENELTSRESVLPTTGASTDQDAEVKEDLNTNLFLQKTKTSNLEEVPEKLLDAESPTSPISVPNAGAEPNRKTARLQPSKLGGDLMEALMEGDHRTVNQLKRETPTHELTQTEINALIANGGRFPDVYADSSDEEEKEEFSEEGQAGDFPDQPAGNAPIRGTAYDLPKHIEAQGFPAGFVENPSYDIAQEPFRNVQFTESETQQPPINFQYPNFQGTAGQSIGLSEYAVGYSSESPVEEGHHFRNIPEHSDGFFPAEHERRFEGNPEQSGLREYPPEYTTQEPVEQGHPFKNFRGKAVGVAGQPIVYNPSEHQLPFEHTQEQSLGTQDHPTGDSPEQSPEMRKYPASRNNMGQSSEDKEFHSGKASEQAFENEEQSEGILEQQAIPLENHAGKTDRQSGEIEDAMEEYSEAVEPALQHLNVPVQPEHMPNNSPLFVSGEVQPYPSGVSLNSPEASITTNQSPSQSDRVIDDSEEGSLEEQSSPYMEENYQPRGVYEVNAVPPSEEIFSNELDSAIMMGNHPNFPEDLVRPPVFGDPYYNQYVREAPSPNNADQFDPYQSNVLESSVKRFDEQKPVEYYQPADNPLLDEDHLQNPTESLSPESRNVIEPPIFEGPLMVDGSLELDGSRMMSNKTSFEELENEVAPVAPLDKLAFSGGPSVFNEGPQVDQYLETRSIPVLGEKLNGAFPRTLDADNELRTAGQQRSTAKEGPTSPFRPRFVSKFSLKEGPSILLPQTGLPNQISSGSPSSLLLPKGTIATPAGILEALPALLQQSVKPSSLSSPVSSIPIPNAPGFAVHSPIPFANLPMHVASNKLAGVLPSGQLVKLQYPFTGNPSPLNPSYQRNYLDNPTNKYPHSPNPWYNLIRPQTPHNLIPCLESIPVESPYHENISYELPQHENFPGELNKNLPEELSHSKNLLRAEEVPYHLLEGPLPESFSQLLAKDAHQDSPSGVFSDHSSHSVPSLHPRISPYPSSPPPTHKTPSSVVPITPSDGVSYQNSEHFLPYFHQPPSPVKGLRDLSSLHNFKRQNYHIPDRYKEEKNSSSSKIENIHNSLSQTNKLYSKAAENPPWLESVTLPATLDSSIINKLQKLDHINGLEHSSSVSASDTSYPLRENSVNNLALNDFLHNEKSVPILTPQIPHQSIALFHAPNANFGTYRPVESPKKYPYPHALSQNEKHLPMLTPQTSHQLKSFAPASITNSERLYPTGLSSVKHSSPQTFFFDGNHSPNLISQNSHQSNNLVPTPTANPAEMSHLTDKNSVIYPPLNTGVPGDKHASVFLHQNPHEVNMLPHATDHETLHPIDKSTVKYPPINAFLHNGKHPSLSAPQTPHTLVDLYPSKFVHSKPPGVDIISPAETYDPRASEKHLSETPLSNIVIKPLPVFEAKHPSPSPFPVYEANHPSPLPSPVYEPKHPSPLHPPIYGAKHPSPLPSSVYEAKHPSPLHRPIYGAKHPSSLSSPINEAKHPNPLPSPVYEAQHPSHLPSPVYEAQHPSHLSSPVYEAKLPYAFLPPVYNVKQQPFLLAAYEANQRPSSPLDDDGDKYPSALHWAVQDANQAAHLPLGVYRSNQRPSSPLAPYEANQRSSSSLDDGAKYPSALHWAVQGANQAAHLPLGVYRSNQRPSSPLASYEAKQPASFPALSNATPSVNPEDEDVPKPAPVGHLARPDTAALLKFNENTIKLSPESLKSLSESQGATNPCSVESPLEKPSTPSLTLVSSQPIEEVKKSVELNGMTASQGQYVPRPYSRKDRIIAFSPNLPGLPIPDSASHTSSQQPPPSLALANSLDPSSVLSHVLNSVPYTWVQPISRGANQNLGLQV